MTDSDELFESVENERKFLEDRLNELIIHIGTIPIASNKIMPYGWRKAAKGRTVWRIVEEVISQNLEYHGLNLGFDTVHPADSEVGVYDFCFCMGKSDRFHRGEWWFSFRKIGRVGT